MVYKQGACPCGKALWIKLWKLWKSWSFPQVNRRFAKSGPRIILHKFLHNGFHNAFVTVLRHRGKVVTADPKNKEKLDFSCFPRIWEKHVHGDVGKNL